MGICQGCSGLIDPAIDDSVSEGLLTGDACDKCLIPHHTGCLLCFGEWRVCADCEQLVPKEPCLTVEARMEHSTGTNGGNGAEVPTVAATGLVSAGGPSNSEEKWSDDQARKFF